MDPHSSLDISPWLARWSHIVTPGARWLDVACGGGRHVRWLASRGAVVTALDRDAEAVGPLRNAAEVVVADIESGPWPLAGRQFDGVLVTNYLWRPLLPVLRSSLAPGGVLVYETFAAGNERHGRPRNPDFLLRPGELLEAFAGLTVVAYECGFADHPPRVVQRLVAADDADAGRHLEPGPAR